MDIPISNLFVESPVDLVLPERVLPSPIPSVSSSSSSSSSVSFVLSTPTRGDMPTIFVLDTSVASLVLDGEAWERVPVDCCTAISGLGSALQRLLPGQTAERDVARVRKGLAALMWYHTVKPNVRITRTVLSELKSSSQVE